MWDTCAIVRATFSASQRDARVYVSTPLGHGVPRDAVKCSPGCVHEGILGLDEHLHWWTLSRADCTPWCGWASFNQLKAWIEQDRPPLSKREFSSRWSLPYHFFLVLEQAAFRRELEHQFSGALQPACPLCGFWTFSVIMWADSFYFYYKEYYLSPHAHCSLWRTLTSTLRM